MKSNKNLGNQLVVMSRDDLDTMVNEMAQNIVAAQIKNVQNDGESGTDVPQEKRFITREETARMLHVKFTTLWPPAHSALLLFYIEIQLIYIVVSLQCTAK